MGQYPQTIYARIVNPDTENQFLLTGSDISEVSDDAVSDSDIVEVKVARYALVGTGEIHHVAPRYIEDDSSL